MQTNTIEVLKQLIAYPTITPQECGIYAYIKEILSDFEILEFEKEGVKNLFLYKDLGAKNAESQRADSNDSNAESQNKKSQKTHLCFAGHIDVVPPGEGWASEPFSPTIKEGFLYGRGAQDMKAGVAAFVCAIREFVDCLESQSLQTAQDSSDSTLQRFNGILSVLLTSDEEGAAIFGTKYTLECLKERDFLPHFAIVAEPTSVEKFGDMIKVGRRGSINGILRVFGKQGHVAYPKKCVNPVELIAPYLSQIAGYELDKGSAEFEPSKLVITDIRGGLEVVNVTPNDLKIMFNVRNSTQTSLEDLRQYLENLLSKIPHSLELNQSSKPFLTNKQSRIVQRIAKVLESKNGFAPKFSTSGGTSDARYFAEYGVSVVECGVCNDSIHSINERVRLSEVESLQNAFLTLLAQWNL
ncbi:MULTISPECIES: succinyl-diaminopimelate desuccinylase [Helicobacter]|uniref:succinyl-diaminopimelate desuccinylase n=1 Tax=Helicobacter TaxID=209 RepID=UPI0026044628|nr:succinyl-diaminopimelate desuccinylase [Helicobacter sp. UBA3407]